MRSRRHGTMVSLALTFAHSVDTSFCNLSSSPDDPRVTIITVEPALPQSTWQYREGLLSCYDAAQSLPPQDRRVLVDSGTTE